METQGLLVVGYMLAAVLEPTITMSYLLDVSEAKASGQYIELLDPLLDRLTSGPLDERSISLFFGLSWSFWLMYYVLFPYEWALNLRIGIAAVNIIASILGHFDLTSRPPTQFISTDLPNRYPIG